MTGRALCVLAFVFGAIVGSFLNACIHRLPRGIKLGNPRRSFCPSCKKQIPWYENIPLISWLVLKARCSQCGAPIPSRYFLVELLTAILFLISWLTFPMPLVFIYWLFLALLIAATFIDFEHLIIPDEITIGGTIAGLILSTLFPPLLGADTFLRGFGLSFLGAAGGFFLLWFVVEAGKRFFGRKRHSFAKGEVFSIREAGGSIILTLEGDDILWDDIFARPTDELVMEGVEGEVHFSSGEKQLMPTLLRIRHDRILFPDKEIFLSEVQEIQGSIAALVIPREAMGFGDVKFIAAIGAFLGWQAVLFTLFFSALSGTVVGATMLAVTRGRDGGKIPFGPYLAFGALLWVFVGPPIVHWYLGMFLFPHTL
ncbi:MAG: prepilin peptidase [Chthoniobacterales bacterium]